VKFSIEKLLKKKIITSNINYSVRETKQIGSQSNGGT